MQWVFTQSLALRSALKRKGVPKAPFLGTAIHDRRVENVLELDAGVDVLLEGGIFSSSSFTSSSSAKISRTLLVEVKVAVLNKRGSVALLFESFILPQPESSPARAGEDSNRPDFRAIDRTLTRSHRGQWNQRNFPGMKCGRGRQQWWQQETSTSVWRTAGGCKVRWLRCQRRIPAEGKGTGRTASISMEAQRKRMAANGPGEDSQVYKIFPLPM